MIAQRAEIVEVGPRHGLQAERDPVPPWDRIRLVDHLSAWGLSRIEVGSFVSPKRVPQMADSAAVLVGICRHPGTRDSALTPNLKGYEAAIAAVANEVAVFASASEAFSQANLQCGIEESLARFVPLLDAARREGLFVRRYLFCVIACPSAGPVSPASVARIASRLRKLGCDEISLGDTIGAGRPETIDAMRRAVLADVPTDRLAGHDHDTDGRACDNIEVRLDHGLRIFDASIAGLGGCPFAPGSPGNADTRAVAELLRRLGYETGLDEQAPDAAAQFASTLKRRNTP